MGLYKSIYNHFGYIIQEHIPKIKSYAMYLGQEIDINQMNSYPAIYLEVAPTNISDMQNNAQLLIFNARLHIFSNVLQSFNWKDRNKDYSGDFLDLIDEVNAAFMTNKIVPEEYTSVSIQSVRRTGIDIIPTPNKVKEAIVTFEFNVIDSTLVKDSEYAEAKTVSTDIELTIE